MPTPSKTALSRKMQVGKKTIAQFKTALRTAKTFPKKLTLLQEQLVKYMDKEVEKALRPAEVTLTVTDFQDVLANAASKYALGKPSNTTATMEIKEDHPRVWIDPSEPNKLRIKPQGATLLFTIKPPRYYPVGITFLRNKGKFRETDRKRLGFLNFDQLRIRPDKYEHSVQVTDRFKEERPDRWYKFCVIIQEAKTGKIGIIDPDIINEP